MRSSSDVADGNGTTLVVTVTLSSPMMSAAKLSGTV